MTILNIEPQWTKPVCCSATALGYWLYGDLQSQIWPMPNSIVSFWCDREMCEYSDVLHHKGELKRVNSECKLSFRP